QSLTSIENSDVFRCRTNGLVVVIGSRNETGAGEALQQGGIVQVQQGFGHLLLEAIAETLVDITTDGPLVVRVGGGSPDYLNGVGIDVAVFQFFFPNLEVQGAHFIGSGLDQAQSAGMVATE